MKALRAIWQAILGRSSDRNADQEFYAQLREFQHEVDEQTEALRAHHQRLDGSAKINRVFEKIRNHNNDRTRDGN